MFLMAPCFSLLVELFWILQDSRRGAVLLEPGCTLEIDLYGTYCKQNIHYIWVNKLC